jgi:hypothetical protein
MHASYTITPIRPDFLERARGLGLDDQDQPIERHVAEGGEPLRDVMRRARPGEAIVLASYCPFSEAGPYREYGPVFIHAAQEDSVMPAWLPTRLPIDGDGTYFNRTFVLRAYSARQRIVDAVLTIPEEAESRLQDLLDRPDVSFVLARFAAYGCYACRVERHAA